MSSPIICLRMSAEILSEPLAFLDARCLRAERTSFGVGSSDAIFVISSFSTVGARVRHSCLKIFGSITCFEANASCWKLAVSRTISEFDVNICVSPCSFVILSEVNDFDSLAARSRLKKVLGRSSRIRFFWRLLF